MGYVFSHHREHRVHGDLKKVFSVFSVRSVVKLFGKSNNYPLSAFHSWIHNLFLR